MLSVVAFSIQWQSQLDGMQTTHFILLFIRVQKKMLADLSITLTAISPK